MNLKIRVSNSSPWSRQIDFWVGEYREGKLFGYAESFLMHSYKEEDYGKILSPSFSLEYEDAQSLMDALWSCGLRPSEGSGSAGALLATQNHLEDMRKLVFSWFMDTNK